MGIEKCSTGSIHILETVINCLVFFSKYSTLVLIKYIFITFCICYTYYQHLHNYEKLGKAVETVGLEANRIWTQEILSLRVELQMNIECSKK